MTGEQQHGTQRRNRVPAKGSARYTSDSEFINRELSKDETAVYRQWREDSETVVTIWTEMLEEGYRVNTKYDDYSSAIACFIIPPTDGENAGFILTGRGGNAWRAIAEAIFKHSEIFHGAWGVNYKPYVPNDDPDF